MKTEAEEYDWLARQGEKISFSDSTEEEKNEFVDYMYGKGKIKQEQYEHYKAGKYKDRILDMALVIGAISLLQYFVRMACSGNKKHLQVLMPGEVLQ